MKLGWEATGSGVMCEGSPYNCSHHLDIQKLTAEQREELIEDLIVLKDAVEEEEVSPSPEEDFV